MIAYRVDAFTKDGAGGNPAGVVPNANDMSPDHMQDVARRLGYSETAFILEPDQSDHTIRYFTPEIEVPICAHATIAAYTWLRDIGKLKNGIYRLHTLDGSFEIRYENDLVSMAQPLPEFGDAIEPQTIADVLNIDLTAINDKVPVQCASTGLWKIFAPIKTLDDLKSIDFDYDNIRDFCGAYGTIGIYAYTLETEAGGNIHARNTAPVVGIEEDSATGTSAAALVCILFKELREYHYPIDIKIEQGYEIASPSEIIVSLSTMGRDITGVNVKGRAKVIDDFNM